MSEQGLGFGQNRWVYVTTDRGMCGELNAAPTLLLSVLLSQKHENH